MLIEVPSLSLFSGAGGLDLGLESAGFHPSLCVELDELCQQTLAANRPKWRLASPGDLHQLTMRQIALQAGIRKGDVGLVHGGPPCQPFSKSGFWANGDARRLKDPRAKTVSAMLDVTAHFLPEVLLIENVEGFAFEGKAEAFRLVCRRLKDINQRHRTNYKPVILKLNAVDFGVPQHRVRMFIVAHRGGKVIRPLEPRYFEWADGDPELSWRSAWDAIGHLNPDPSVELSAGGKWAELLPTIPEGQNYLWHTDRGGGEPIFGWRRRYWSFLLKLAKNRPSWTIQAAPGPATGPFHWSNRRLSTRELLCLQTFPEGFEVKGAYRDAHVQIGNAVPPALAAALGRHLRAEFWGRQMSSDVDAFVAPKRESCPPPESPTQVPRAFQKMKLDRTPHPGRGLGPGRTKKTIHS